MRSIHIKFQSTQFKVKNEIVHLSFPLSPFIHPYSIFHSPLSRYEIRPKDRKGIDLDIQAFINSKYPNSSGIIYCTSKRVCEETAGRLSNEFGLSAQHYHAGLDKVDRTRIQREWAKGKVKIIVATVAFGMGIDKGDVRFVIHYSLPFSIEAYYQVKIVKLSKRRSD